LTSGSDNGHVPSPRSALPALVAIVLLALPGTAQASSARAKTVTPLSAASAVAARFWAATPCGDHIALRTRSALPAGLTAESDAWVTFSSPLGANNLTAPASTYGDCTISFGRARWPTTASLREDWDMFCMTMVHEYGHLLGHAHDLTPGSVMAPIFTDYSSEPASCRNMMPRMAR
jgi:matrixin